MTALPSYAELLCTSNFSFLTGASHPEELVARAVELGYAALAITDECSLSGVVRAHVEAKVRSLPLIIGAQMRLTPTRDCGLAMRLVLLAQTRRGYGNLSEWITVARRRAPKGSYLAHATDVQGKVPHLPYIAGLPDCLALLLPEPGDDFESLLAHALWLKTWFGERAGLGLPLLHGPHDKLWLDVVPRVAELTDLPLLAVGDVLMHLRSRKPLQDVLTATRLKQTVAECGYALQPNAEAHLRSRARLAQLYKPEWLAATVRWAASCSFSLDVLKYEYPREIVPEGETLAGYLRRLAEEGSRTRYPQGVPAEVLKQIEHELALIAQLNYEPYFLTVFDIVRWARAQNILCQGRGSAANSTVCFCLYVTAVDPEKTGLLFERFISAERGEPPDIDLDFEHEHREEVIQYIYQKYGRHRAALTAVNIRYRPRSALRDVGRALGLDLAVIEAVSKTQQWFDGSQVDYARLQEQGLDVAAPLIRLWMELTQALINFPRHLSQHPGGFVIARDQIAQLLPVENAAMENRSVVQWDKDDLDALGILKVDILALGMLTAIRRALDFIAAKLGRESFAMTEVPQDEDKASYEMLCRADTIGVFQVESRAQMSMLPRLKPREYYDLVIQVAIVRPGPIQGGMVHPYLRRRSGEEPVDWPSDEVREALGRTLGIPIFQEQVMQLAIKAADFTPGEADQLRRAMAAWKRKGGLGPFHERLVGRMVKKGYEPEFAERIFKQIQGFGEYGFPESHAASFALLVYISAWLKCHHPDAFLAGLLNSWPMGFYAPAQLVRDAREHGVQVLPARVELSDWEAKLEPLTGGEGGALHIGVPGVVLSAQTEALLAPLQPVRLGLNSIKGLARAVAERIVAARAEQALSTVEDLSRRAELTAHDLNVLAEADALRALTGHRHQAAWVVAGVDTRPTALLREARTEEAEVLLAAPTVAEELQADYRRSGLTLGPHPLALLREQLNAFKVQPAAVLNRFPDGRLARASGIVTHRQRPGTAKGTMFVTLEDDTGQVNIIVWPRVAEAQRKPLLAARLMTVYGQWQCQGEVKHLVAAMIIDHSHLMDGLVSRSRDFR
ncbi:MAG: error-prone DNA polymerase [Burkholderiaceae bacterium]|nr:error-prone DNA polymerase [Burkholderiaceae bacterium]